MSNEQSPLVSPIDPNSNNRRTRYSYKNLAMSMWTLGCMYGATSVILGAFGAHGLKKRIAGKKTMSVLDSS